MHCVSCFAQLYKTECRCGPRCWIHFTSEILTTRRSC